MKKETTQYRIDNKLCTRCGKPAAPNRKMCDKHLEESRLKTKKKTELWKNQNICTRCGQRPPRPDKTQCEICVDKDGGKYNATKMDTYYHRRSAGNCVRCGESTSEFSVHCDICAEYMKQKDKARYNKLKNSGLCAHCGKLPPINDEILCLICKDKNAVVGKNNRTKQKMTIIHHYGGKCKFCGREDMDVLSMDHIHGGGFKHRKELESQGTIFYRWLIKNNYPTGFQVLCLNCNMKKHLNGGVCPHQNQ